MKKEDLFESVSMIDDDLIAEYDSRRETLAAKKPRVLRLRRAVLIAAAAACLAVVAAAGSAVAIIAEAKEYSEAVEFFEENGLSTEGLSRSEVKEVYRDITTQRFEKEKTEEVIRNAVYGTEIYLEGPTPEETAATLWDRNVNWKTVSKIGTNFTFDYTHSEGMTYTKSSIINCYKDGELKWTSEITDFVATDCVKTSAGIAVWGRGKVYYNSRYLPAYIALLDENGKMLWEHRLGHGSESELVVNVLENSDGTFSVISRVDLKYLYLSKYGTDGTRLKYHIADLGSSYYGVGTAAHLGDGYIVCLASSIENEYALVCKLDSEGNIIDRISYDSDETIYYITDMAEFGGKLYISAYSVPRQEDAGGRNEIANILKFCFEKSQDYAERAAREGIEARTEDIVSSEELTPVVRDNYTAVLLVCDPDTGKPATFYSVKGARGDKLTVAGERLDWDVNSITSAIFSPGTSSFTIAGTCKVRRYSFDTEGALLWQADTGKTDSFRR